MWGIHRARLLAGVFVGGLLMSACVHRVSLPETPAALIPQRVELAGTPFFPQERYQCGPAALATVLKARGVRVVPDMLVPQVYLPARGGSLQVEMIAAARRQGLLAIPVQPSLDGLLAEVAAGRPVLVMQNLGLNWLPRWHYAVVIGYDLARQELVLRSGTEARRVTPFGVFMNTWDRSKRWGFVVLPPDELPPQMTSGPWLAAASALESLGKWPQAQAAYRAATLRWPDNPIAWFGLGNAEHALGDTSAAGQAFRQVLRIQPDSAVAWNNLAHVLARRQCVHAARDAAQCALHLAPDHPDIRRTADEMASVPGVGSTHCQALPACPPR